MSVLTPVDHKMQRKSHACTLYKYMNNDDPLNDDFSIPLNLATLEDIRAELRSRTNQEWFLLYRAHDLKAWIWEITDVLDKRAFVEMLIELKMLTHQMTAYLEAYPNGR